MVWTPKLCTALTLLLAGAVVAHATSGKSAQTPAQEHPSKPSLPRVLTPGTPTTVPGTKAHQPGQWPKTLPKDNPVSPAESAWPADEVKAARQRCDAMLAGLDIVAVPAEPIREGECGAVAPIELISVGRNPQVTFSSPAIVTCDLAVAFDKWMKTDIQAYARENLGSAIVRVEIMSAYSCRNAYGRKKSRISEHGKANALDVRGFLTEKGVTVDLLTDWGPTERDIRAQVAAAAAKAKAEEERAETLKREAEKAAAARSIKNENAGSGRKPSADPSAAATQSAPNETPLRGTVDDSPPIAGGTRSWRPPSSLSLTPPARLGGPKSEKKDGKAPVETNSPPPSASNAPVQAALPPKTRFLRRAHTSACRTFGTILGPEANEAHRNHFHIDMAERQTGNYCE